MAEPVDILLERIEEQLAKKGKSGWWLSKQITGGQQEGVVKDIKRRRSLPSLERLITMAEALDTTVDYLLGKTDNPGQPVSEVTFGEMPREFANRHPLQDLPVLGTGYCADLIIDNDGQSLNVEQTLFEPGHVVRMIMRPDALRGAKEAYAIYFQGDSMEPRFYAGDLGIVDPRRPAGPGDDVVVQLNNGSDDAVVTVLVKRLVRSSASHVELEQFNPPLRFRVDRTRIARMHRLMPQVELFRA